MFDDKTTDPNNEPEDMFGDVDAIFNTPPPVIPQSSAGLDVVGTLPEPAPASTSAPMASASPNPAGAMPSMNTAVSMDEKQDVALNSVASPAPQQPTSSPAPTPVMPQGVPVAPVAPPPSGGGGGMWLAVIIVIAILGILGVSVYLVYAFVIEPNQGTDDIRSLPDIETPTPAPAPTPTPTPAPIPEPAPDPVEVDGMLDTDGDGLTDKEEAIYGTNARLADTDRDGLSDTEEILEYETDPLDPDSDGDSFLDGVEVEGGYDPNGPGKLFDQPKQ